MTGNDEDWRGDAIRGTWSESRAPSASCAIVPEWGLYPRNDTRNPCRIHYLTF
jgi:hypothetical protein